MSLLSRIKGHFKSEPQEQALGYSVPELKSIFAKPSTDAPDPHHYPASTSLTSAGIHAHYTCFVVDKADVGKLQALIDKRFSAVDQRAFGTLLVTHYLDQTEAESLLASISYEEFNVATIRLVTNSSGLLNLIGRTKFAAPPPWIAFPDYNATWWGGDMQGAQGYYNDHYFFPFFSALSASERDDYYAKYAASEEWISSLELTLDQDDDLRLAEIVRERRGGPTVRVDVDELIIEANGAAKD